MPFVNGAGGAKTGNKQMNTLTKTSNLMLHIDGRLWPYTGAEAASTIYLASIAKADVGASETPLCEILDNNMNPVGRVSYNGRVWELGPENHDGTFNHERCIYNPARAAR
jgi:hypothetical protein